MTQLCTYCGSTYDLLGGHTCTPTFMSTGTVVQHTYTNGCDGHHSPGPCPAKPRPVVRLVLENIDALSDADLDALADRLAPKIEQRMRRLQRLRGNA
jgi:hypothetical protein